MLSAKVLVIVIKHDIFYIKLGEWHKKWNILPFITLSRCQGHKKAKQYCTVSLHGRNLEMILKLHSFSSSLQRNKHDVILILIKYVNNLTDVNVICGGHSWIIELTNNYLLNIMQCVYQ